ncbi:MAG: bifunctional 4-hydroxy-2-oxoglutarate aldolase/2-dehydro-3-deoxy-phosphogluconate aldolase [Clostridiales bacterium]|nr:bifunctional 4-hydroxy-2-oxoglutarate aldolase/2-dehydro-3-deoxy-phosphogluconate aldolase [Clostridiales bacterium]
MSIINDISLYGLLPVIKIEDASDAVPLVGALKEGGLPVAEITFRTDAAAQSIELATKAFPDALIGAGTVLSVDQLKKAVDAGAKFAVSPGFNPKVVSYAAEHNIPMVPGVATPGDIEAALEMGIDCVKLFPAEVLGGVAYIKALSGPYGKLKFVPTGGVNEANMLSYLSLKQVAAIGGSFMAPSDLIKRKDWNGISAAAKASVSKVLGMELMHVGINTHTPEEAAEGAFFLSQLMGLQVKESADAFMVGGEFEICKQKKPGKFGHIAIGVNNILRAIRQFTDRGYELETPLLDDKGEIKAAYLKQEVCGFALHLLRK